MLLLISFISLYSLLKNSSIDLRRVCAFLLLSVVVSGCNDTKMNIEADDFGFPKVFIESKGKNVTGEKENQLAEWEFSGFRYNGSLAVVMVYNDVGDGSTVWTSWFGNGESYITEGMGSSPYCCIGGSIDNNGNCNNPQYCKKPDDKYENITNAPCIFSQGQGLYMLLTKPSNTGVTDPNTYKNVNRAPSSAGFFTIGLWQYTGMYQNNQLANGYIAGFIDPTATTAGTAVVDSQESSNVDNSTLSSTTTYTNITIPQDNVNGDAYFKILDRYYDDNSGTYFVSLKNGFNSTVTPPIASAINIVMTNLNNASQALFQRVIEDGNYRQILRASLSLYIIVYGIMFVGGMVSISQKDMIKMMMKLIIVIQLLTTTTSWDVFNNYFFRFFTGGLTEIIGIITSTISGAYGGGEGGSGLTFFDAMLGLLFSYETTMKIMAVVLSVKSGIVVAAMIYVAFGMFILSLAKAVMLYLLAYIAISLFIATAPFFIVFMLFKPTKMIFDNWLNQLVSYFFQPILVFASLAMIGQAIINKMYRLLGFKACYENWIKVGDTVIAKMWKICDFDPSTHILSTIPIPGYGYWDLDNPDNFCSPYLCSARRYIDLPFLVPADASGSPSYDQSFIDAFASPATLLNLPMLYNALILMLMSFLLFLFHDTIPALAKGIAGTATGAGDGSSGLSRTAASAVKNVVGAVRGIPGAIGYVVAQQMKKSAKGRKLLESYNKKKDKFNKLFAEPKNKNKTLQAIGKGFSSVGKAAHFAFRVAVPPGSLMNTVEREQAERDGTLATTEYGEKIKSAIFKKTGLSNIIDGADAFDERVSKFRTGVVDTIGRSFDFRKKGTLDRAEEIALLRKAGLLDAEYGSEPKNEQSKMARRRDIENNLTALDIKRLKMSANAEQKARMEQLKINLEIVREQAQLKRQQKFDDKINTVANYAVNAADSLSAGAKSIGKNTKAFANAAPSYAAHGIESVYRAPTRMAQGTLQLGRSALDKIKDANVSRIIMQEDMSQAFAIKKAKAQIFFDNPKAIIKDAGIRAGMHAKHKALRGVSVIKQGSQDALHKVWHSSADVKHRIGASGSMAASDLNQSRLNFQTKVVHAPFKLASAAKQGFLDSAHSAGKNIRDKFSATRESSLDSVHGTVSSTRDKFSAKRDEMLTSTSAILDSGRDKLSAAREAAFNAKHTALDGASSVNQAIGDKYHQLRNSAGENIRAAKQDAMDSIHASGRSISDSLHESGRSASDSLHEKSRSLSDTAAAIDRSVREKTDAVIKASNDASRAAKGANDSIGNTIYAAGRGVEGVVYSSQRLKTDVTKTASDIHHTDISAKALDAAGRGINTVGEVAGEAWDATKRAPVEALDAAGRAIDIAKKSAMEGAEKARIATIDGLIAGDAGRAASHAIGEAKDIAKKSVMEGAEKARIATIDGLIAAGDGARALEAGRAAEAATVRGDREAKSKIAEITRNDRLQAARDARALKLKEFTDKQTKKIDQLKDDGGKKARQEQQAAYTADRENKAMDSTNKRSLATSEARDKRAELSNATKLRNVEKASAAKEERKKEGSYKEEAQKRNVERKIQAATNTENRKQTALDKDIKRTNDAAIKTQARKDAADKRDTDRKLQAATNAELREATKRVENATREERDRARNLERSEKAKALTEARKANTEAAKLAREIKAKELNEARELKSKSLIMARDQKSKDLIDARQAQKDAIKGIDEMRTKELKAIREKERADIEQARETRNKETGAATTDKRDAVNKAQEARQKAFDTVAKEREEAIKAAQSISSDREKSEAIKAAREIAAMKMDAAEAVAKKKMDDADKVYKDKIQALNKYEKEMIGQAKEVANRETKQIKELAKSGVSEVDRAAKDKISEIDNIANDRAKLIESAANEQAKRADDRANDSVFKANKSGQEKMAKAELNAEIRNAAISRKEKSLVKEELGTVLENVSQKKENDKQELDQRLSNRDGESQIEVAERSIRNQDAQLARDHKKEKNEEMARLSRKEKEDKKVMQDERDARLKDIEEKRLAAIKKVMEEEAIKNSAHSAIDQKAIEDSRKAMQEESRINTKQRRAEQEKIDRIKSSEFGSKEAAKEVQGSRDLADKQALEIKHNKEKMVDNVFEDAKQARERAQKETDTKIVSINQEAKLRKDSVKQDYKDAKSASKALIKGHKDATEVAYQDAKQEAKGMIKSRNKMMKEEDDR